MGTRLDNGFDHIVKHLIGVIDFRFAIALDVALENGGHIAQFPDLEQVVLDTLGVNLGSDILYGQVTAALREVVADICALGVNLPVWGRVCYVEDELLRESAPGNGRNGGIQAVKHCLSIVVSTVGVQLLNELQNIILTREVLNLRDVSVFGLFF